jgi:hypothetical protein
MQIRERDTWIGWHPDVFLSQAKESPSDEVARWLARIVDVAVSEIYVEDLIEEGILSAGDLASPSPEVISRLAEHGAEQRRLHHRYARSKDHKRAGVAAGEPVDWVKKARSHLFRSKRSLGLATYLATRTMLKKTFGSRPTAAMLLEMAGTREGGEAIRKILRKAKADRVGISVADITVCGAVQPYNAILGGKLVAMLCTSPEVLLEYCHRYSEAESEIASSIAGRAILRSPTLALLGTTSLYGVGSSQYNRIRIPCDRLGGAPTDVISYEDLGHSEAYGTSQYAEDTVDALVDIVQQSADGQRVNSIFGEGQSPKMRKIRQGLDLLRLPTDALLRHHRRRVVYAVRLARNLGRYLLGIDSQPDYFVPLKDGPGSTAAIASWWRERWLKNRIASDDVLSEVARHTLIRPIRHGARVVVPDSASDRQLEFSELG